MNFIIRFHSTYHSDRYTDIGRAALYEFIKIYPSYILFAAILERREEWGGRGRVSQSAGRSRCFVRSSPNNRKFERTKYNKLPMRSGLYLRAEPFVGFFFPAHPARRPAAARQRLIEHVFQIIKQFRARAAPTAARRTLKKEKLLRKKKSAGRLGPFE
ncbi:hypothetical protein EVAR_45905_1 [Eumeta japonica]|uniref:Uncharacterized protein n=1 Tax=Eumeta variegata TaxID=151549 RepID=A0A4C1XTU0_EUMVA|nr:hypothetical protein EVAR_45905_1 [Eumeta japonica]